MLTIPLVIFFFGKCFAEQSFHYGKNTLSDLKTDFDQMNSELKKLNSILSFLSWKLMTEPDAGLSSNVTDFGNFQIQWRKKWCLKFNDDFQKILDLGMSFQNEEVFPEEFPTLLRGVHLLCRGPVYDSEQNRLLINVLGKLESIYETSEVCVDSETCFRGEPDLERIMAKSRNPKILLWAWTEWRNKVGPPSRAVYPLLVNILNLGAKNNGYREIGECWREELEVKNLENLVENLYGQIEPLYIALHAVVRYKLQQYYGPDLISLNEPLPAHLLGNMWAQNWGNLLDMIVDVNKEESFTYYLKKKNFTLTDLVKSAEDFFVLLGFQPMTKSFWKYSKLLFQAQNGSTCHGTAANMFQKNDYRIILCAEVNEEDFSVIYHEMGHIEYYMEYADQPAIFQDGVNSAFQEAIGDAIMYGVVSPGHLHRLGIIKETNSDADIKLLLHQALIKLPQIPFALMLEKWRWNVFKGNISPSNYNKAWWSLRHNYQGVKPPVHRTEEDFDPSGKFHINDNKPYIRYFLSSILQMQVFESLCKAAIFGDNNKNLTLPIPLHRCDIYGSKSATEKLRKMMSLGSSISWKKALNIITGEDSYSVRPLLNYYQPLYKWLLMQIKEHNIPVGWSPGRQENEEYIHTKDSIVNYSNNIKIKSF